MNTSLIPPSISPVEAWQMVSEQLALQMNPTAFDSYIRDAVALDFSGDVFTLALPTPEARDWAQSRLTRTIENHLAPLIGCPVRVAFCCQQRQPEATIAPPEPPEALYAPPSLDMEETDEIESSPSEDEATGAGDDDDCQTLVFDEVADTLEAALLRPGRIIAFPRYELRHLPLVGPEFFFLRIAFLQERYLNTPAGDRTQPFETYVESLLRWANVGRATLHRFKKGDPVRGVSPAAGWFGIEQLPSPPRSADSPQQPPCRYRIQQGIPLTPMDADRLYELLIAAGIQTDPLQALQDLHSRPIHEILQFPPPAPTPEQKKRTPTFTTVAGVVQSALGRRKIEPDLRPRLQEWVNKLSDHITMPNQTVHVSWYFLQEWLPLLGHDAAALILYTRSQGYYNPQTHELRDEIPVNGGYGELASIIGLKRSRTISDWLQNIFDRQPNPDPGESDKWQREQQRREEMRALVRHFIRLVDGTRRKMPEGHYAFNLHVKITADPLTPADQWLATWVYRILQDCEDAGVLEHFHAWVTSPVIAELAQKYENSAELASDLCDQNDGWGILGIAKMTAGESGRLQNAGWGILGNVLNDGAGILGGVKMTAGELFKGLFKLSTYWDSILLKKTTTQTNANSDAKAVVVEPWNLRSLLIHNGGMNALREQILKQETSPQPFLSWICYAYSLKGRGVEDPVGWALSRLKEQPHAYAEGVFARLAHKPTAEFARLLRAQIETGAAPMDEDWRAAFGDVPVKRLKALAETLGLEG